MAVGLCVTVAGGAARTAEGGAAERPPARQGASARLLRPEVVAELARHRQVAPDGTVTFLSGVLGVVAGGESKDTAPAQQALERTARRFLQHRLAELTGHSSLEAPGLVFESAFEIDGGSWALHARQLWRGVELMDSGLSFVFADRTLVAFAGRVRAPQPLSAATVLSPPKALAALERHAAPGLPADRRLRATAEGGYVVEDAAGRSHLELARVIDPETAETVWLAVRGSERWTIGGRDETRVVSRGSVRRAIAYTSVPIRHGDAPAGTADWMEPLSNLTPVDVSMSVQREDIAPGLCRYNLRYDEFRANGISPQVLDYSPGAWQSWQPIAPCTGLLPGLDFRRGPDSPSAYRQQHYYYWLRRTGDYVRSRVFNTFGPLSDWDVGLAVNEPTGSCGPNASACFLWNPFSRWIHLTENSSGEHPSIRTLFHEYGHYFNWTYGGSSGNCRDGDEGNALDETIADAIALLVGKHYFDPQFGDVGGLAFLGDGSEYPLRFTAGAMGCFLSGDEHVMGRPFVQALWQVAFGANCHTAPCNATMTGIRADIGWPSASSARDHLLRALAYALKLLPPSATHEQVVAFMHIYLMSYTDVTVANNVLAVFRSHGL